MNPQIITHSPYTLLPSGILIVEPHEGLLAARTMLLAAADYYVGEVALNGAETCKTGNGQYDVAVAILSESLGCLLLSATARVVRERWPYARILIFGQDSASIEDNLYDSRIDHKARPEDLLSALLALSEDPWNQRAKPQGTITNGKARIPISSVYDIAESDPTKRLTVGVGKPLPRDMPASEQHFRKAS